MPLRRAEKTVPVLGARLAAARRARGLSQRALGERLGLTAVKVCMIERGHRTPSLARFLALTDALDVAADFLLGRTDVLRLDFGAQALIGAEQAPGWAFAGKEGAA